MDTNEHALKRAIAAAGSTTKLAEALGITTQAISQWKAVPLTRVPEVAALTGLPKHEIRPDFFDAPAPAPSEAAA